MKNVQEVLSFPSNRKATIKSFFNFQQTPSCAYITSQRCLPVSTHICSQIKFQNLMLSPSSPSLVVVVSLSHLLYSSTVGPKQQRINARIKVTQNQEPNDIVDDKYSQNIATHSRLIECKSKSASTFIYIFFRSLFILRAQICVLVWICSGLHRPEKALKCS